MFKLNIFPGSALYFKFQKEKPKPLSNKEYEYWGWIYQMILRSKETEEIADFGLKYETFFKDNIWILQNLFDEALGKFVIRDKLCARRDIKKGEVINRMMYERKKTSQKEGIFFDETRRILSKVACKDIKKGDLLLWKDFFGAYQDVGAGKLF